MIDGPNTTVYDNSIGPNALYVLCTVVCGPAVDGPQLVVGRARIGSDPDALVKQGVAMKEEFARNNVDAELFYRVVQAG
jgi:hypothetical protein